MIYEEFAPPRALGGIVANFWRFSLEPDDPPKLGHVVPPDGTLLLVIAVEATVAPPMVVGPRLSALHVPVRRGVRYIGVRFRPGSGAVLVGASPRGLRESVLPLAEVAPGKAADLVDTLEPMQSTADLLAQVERLVLRWVECEPAPDHAVALMVGQIAARRGDLPMRALASTAGLSYRQALRRFQDAVGLSPKQFARLTRLRQACIQALASEGARWAHISVDSGFADQAHLGREFSDVYGWPPELVREYLRRIEHVSVSD